MFITLKNDFLVTLTTDFGVSSPYVAAMKGSLLSIATRVHLVDLTHAISPQDVRQAAVVLADVTPFFPAGTLHVVVVDPGVGTRRRILYAEIGEQRYLAPDNGVLSYLTLSLAPQCLIEVAEAKYWRPGVSHTFHGRDIFAPVAAHLAAGVAPDQLGPVTNQMVCLDWPEPTLAADEVAAEVLFIDSFGNSITNLPIATLREWLGKSGIRIEVLGREIGELQTTYGQREPGELIALGDSQGRLEVAIVHGNAAKSLGIVPGTKVRILRRFSPSPHS